MTQHVHRLMGCAPAPLAHYLKGLGVLRLVAQQKDEHARAFWRDDELFLSTTMSRAELVTFFLTEYEPTPMLTPWNGGSGFYPKDQKIGIDTISRSDVPRLRAYRDAIEVARTLIGDRKESPKGEEKAELLKACKARWSGVALEWANAATVVTQASEIAYPALLGSGGNDGRLDFANNFMQRLVELLPTTAGDEPSITSRAFLEQALFGGPLREMWSAAVGQFLPGGAGGVNASSGFTGNARLNPWDFVLMLEGASALQVAAVRRLDATGGRGLPQASAPFAVRARAGGYASAAPSDESARGEQWFPLWGRPATFVEVRALFSEGRLQAGRKRAGEALEAAQALARVGTARGVESFQRYAFAERNGQANLAVPVGRWRVGSRPKREAQLTEEIAEWVGQLRRAGAQQVAFARHARRIEGLMLSLLQQSEGNSAALIVRLLEALGSAEAEMVRRPRATAEANLRPIPPLSEGWIELAGEGKTEFRLARAIATQLDANDGSSLRKHLAPLDGRRFRTGQEGLAKDADVVWLDRDLVTDLGAVVLRRLLTVESDGLFPLASYRPVGLDEIAEFLAGNVDAAKVGRLTRALLALQHPRRVFGGGPATFKRRLRTEDLKLRVPAAYALFRVLFSPFPLDDPPWDQDGRTFFPALSPRPHSAPVRQLLAGRLDVAAAWAVARLTQSGARPRITTFAGSAEFARRLVASLAIPVAELDLQRLATLVFKPDIVGSVQDAPELPLPEPELSR